MRMRDEMIANGLFYNVEHVTDRGVTEMTVTNVWM